MEPAPEWTSAVEQSCAVVVAAVQSAGVEVEAQAFWSFLRQGGRPPPSSLPSAPPPVTTAASPEVYEFVPDAEQQVDGAQREFVTRPAPEFSAAPALLDAEDVDGYAAAVSAKGAVLCGYEGEEALATARPPWPVAKFCCGFTRGQSCAAAVRRGGGAVCTWNIGINEHAQLPELRVLEVAGLPPNDAVTAVAATLGLTLALTSSGAPYGWGCSFAESGLAPTSTTAVRIRAPQAVRSIACSAFCVLAETVDNELAYHILNTGYADQLQLAFYPHRGSVALPLRHMAAGRCQFILADAHGTVFHMGFDFDPNSLLDPERVHLPEGQRAVRVAGAPIDREWEAFVILTERGELWECVHTATRDSFRVRSIHASYPGLPLGLQPCGGTDSSRILLLPDRSCGKARLRLCARIAVRLRVPSDPMREVLTRYAVADHYLVGPAHEPFSWPDPAAGAAGAAAAAGHP